MTFTLAHMSDIHAGYKSTKVTNSQGINLREADGYIALAGCVGEIIENQVDAVVITGDVFHVPTPDVRTVVFVQNQVRRFWGAKIPVYILSGNHDTNDIRADVSASRILHDPDRKLYSHFEPYVSYEINRDLYLHLVSHHHYTDQASTMKDVKPVEGAINIFATHGSIIDPFLKIKLHTKQSPREIVIPDYLFEDLMWDYTLLGHIHERGWVGSSDGVSDTYDSKIFYNGSLIRRGFSDKDAPLGRGWTQWDIDSQGEFTPTHHTVPQRPQIDFPIIDAEGKSSKEISDEVIAYLASTDLSSGEFDPSIAPILRQRISSIDPAKYSALDLNAINNNSRHALQWSVQIMTPGEVENHEINAALSFETKDMVKIYDEWVKDSKRLDRTDKEIRETVKNQARTFVETGQEVILND